MLDIAEKLTKRQPPSYRRSQSKTSGFSDSAAQGLRDLDARVPPVEAYAQTPQVRYARTARLRSDVAAGGGLITGADGQARPHYLGHRERLRQRFLTGGHAGMPEYELLELLLFNAIRRIDVKPLAKRLLSTFGDLNGVIAASEHRILKVEGATDKVWLQLRIAEAIAHRMGQAKVVQKSALTNWNDMIDYCRTTMAHRDTEMFRILFLDARNVVIADKEQARGTIDHVPVYPREVAKRALELSAASMILVHNHPSGSVTPSQADIAMTADIARACKTIDVDLYDHVVNRHAILTP
ncbi:DNA repair protein RadC [Salipiger sp. IMCC34102]|nr:DNA repair protein RadC [Salipiger sp. IMCC34102]